MATLLVGYTAADLFARGKHGKKAKAAWLTDDATCHCLDIYHRHAIEKTHHLKAVCTPHLPEGPWDVIRFKTGPKRMSGELALDLLQEIAQLLHGDLRAPRFELIFEGRERDRNDLLGKIRDKPDRVRDFSATWKASVPGIEPISFTSFPGCFCHRRRDEGGLALAEVASRQLLERPDTGEEISVLDMGCGCGLVGLLMARAVKGIRLVGVDSHSRAIEAANLNARNQGVAAEMILADNGTPARMDGTFDVFVGNPPYYSDYRIAEVFLDTAKRALKPGGVCYTICKNAAGLEPVQRRYFPGVEIIKRRGYAVLKSESPR
ncbi:MAG: class I SAM-dependent methyltransferase [Kiritimatiellia bacterium]